MADIAFCCPSCGHVYQFAAHLAGKRGRCKRCQAVFTIPVQAPEPSPPARTATIPVLTPPTLTPSSASAPVTKPAEPNKIVFTCPTCGHGYRLAAKLAGKQGRCTECRGVFTIPLASTLDDSRADAKESGASDWGRLKGPAGQSLSPSASIQKPQTARPKSTVPEPRETESRRDRWSEQGIVTAVPIPDDTEDDGDWWELDSSESIPAIMARPVRHATSSESIPASDYWADDEQAGVKPLSAKALQAQRTNWVTYAGVFLGGSVGVILLVVSLSLVFGSRGPAPKAVVDRSTPEVSAPSPSVAEVAEIAEPEPEPEVESPQKKNGSNPETHAAVIDSLTRAYAEIAEGYAEINDASSISNGETRIARSVEQLKVAAQHGRTLPPLSAGEYSALTRSKGPLLLQAVDRVIQQLRRLKGTPGIKSDFDRLIDAYTRARQGIEREMQGPSPNVPQPPNFGRPQAPVPNFPRPPNFGRPQAPQIPRRGPTMPRGRFGGRP